RSRLRRDERHAEDARQRLAHQRLAGARRADHEHIALGDRHAVLRRLRYLAEMGVDGDSNDLLGIILTDDIAVEGLDDSAWGQFRVEHGSLGVRDVPASYRAAGGAMVAPSMPFARNAAATNPDAFISSTNAAR